MIKQQIVLLLFICLISYLASVTQIVLQLDQHFTVAKQHIPTH